MQDITSEIDTDQNSGLQCLVSIAEHLGVKADMANLSRKYNLSTHKTDWQILQKIANDMHFKTQILEPAADEFREIPVPCMVQLKNGNFVVMGWNSEESVFMMDPSLPKPVAVTRQQFLDIWTGKIMVFTAPFDWRLFIRKYNVKWFYTVIMHYKKYLVEVIMASIFLQVLGLATPLFTQVIIDKVLVNHGLSTLDVLGILLLILVGFQASMSMLRTYLLSHTTIKLDAILGSRLFRHVVTLPLPYFEHRRVGDTLMRIGALNSIREFLTGTAITAFLDVIFSVVFLAVMLYYSVPLTLLALIAVPLYLVQNIIATPIFQRKLEAVWRTAAASNAFLVEAITGIHTVKSLAIEPQFNNKWEKLLARNVKTGFDMATFSIITTNSGSLIKQISGFTVLLYGGHMVMGGKMTLGELIAFQMLSSQAISPLLSLMEMWPSAQQAGLSMERLGDILNTRRESALQPSPANTSPFAGQIMLDNITFRYRLDTPEVLQGINLRLAAGKKIGIVGRSGSGKSTLTHLIQGLYKPDTGRILIDGTDIASMDLTTLRQQIGVVMQDNYLFNGSVRDNIALSKPSASMDEIIRAAQIAGAHDFILELAEGYDTKVGERGTMLSGGQRQRIAIARALLTNPRILIFDEATSALDYESERIVMKNINQMAYGRTLLMIAHRLSTVQNFDQIVVLDHGRIVEQGTHAELIAQAGLYQNLYLQQEG